MTHEAVTPKQSYTPRNLRRKNNASRNGTVGPEKAQAFRSAKRISDKFIHQSASMLEKMGQQYAEYRGICDREALRKGK